MAAAIAPKRQGPGRILQPGAGCRSAAFELKWPGGPFIADDICASIKMVEWLASRTSLMQKMQRFCRNNGDK